ncbi:hypothetical protein DF268_28210 [Streptomyces sp. V2]|uniref:hypothetical protein n=1 Tax=Streptomyces TaxID=1883 RepID=UPI000D66A4A6|nr:hypothetical protein [Streptomyces sp. V2]PWG10216.1 hypothetical protein DF268_28210 [Streptomyces sp. V2]
MHHHAYVWTGPKARFDNEALRRPPHPQPPSPPTDPAGERLLHRYWEVAAEFPASDLPPIEPAHWLLKPSSLIHGTWTDPDQAVAWLSGQLHAHAPRFAAERDRAPARLTTLAASTLVRLKAGNDVVLGLYLEHSAFLHLALITCSPNRSRPELPCPAPQMR